MKRNLFIVILCCFYFINSAQYAKSEILSDLEQLSSVIKEKHVAPYWLNSKEKVEEVIANAKLKIALKGNCDESCIVELMKIIASLKDGHSSMSGSSRYEVFGYFPISLRWFDGELRVIRTIESYKEILGSKITAVNGKPISDVLSILSEVVPQANKYRFQKFAGSYLHLPGLLFGLGITDDPDRAQFSFENEKEKIGLILENLTQEEEDNQTFVSFLDDRQNLPLYQRNNSDYYWFEYNKKEKLFYFQYNRVGNMKSEGSTAFAKRMWSHVDSVDVEKFVLDLRYNGGGNFPFSIRFIQGIVDRLDINKNGRLFIITGYETFSAAIDMLNELELKSKAIVLGEYPCDHPSRPGDPEEYILSKTGIEINLSSLYHPTAILGDNRTRSSLDKEIITSWEDYNNGIDPVMEYIQSYNKPERIPARSEDYQQSVGSYTYSPVRDLKIIDRNGALWLEISRALETPLYPDSGKYFSTELPGMKVTFNSDELGIIFPGGKERSFQKIGPIKNSAIDYLYEGNIIEAREIFMKVKSEQPDLIDLKDHMICFQANMIYFDLIKYPDKKAAQIAKEVLELGIELNDGNAPFCNYTLKFYQ